MGGKQIVAQREEERVAWIYSQLVQPTRLHHTRIGLHDKPAHHQEVRDLHGFQSHMPSPHRNGNPFLRNLHECSC